MNDYSIVITTFDQRFDPFLKPLVSTIRALRPAIEVMVMVNGPSKGHFDPIYRSSLLQFLATQENCYPTLFPNFQALAKLWNRGALTATNNRVLVLNDDLDIDCTSQPNFFETFEKVLETEHRTFKINGSFSHFCLSKKELMNVGFFDERLLGIGEEDGDFAWRYHETYDTEIASIEISGIHNIQSTLADNGYSKGIGHYSIFNRDFIKNQKYQEVFLGGYKGMFDKRSIKKLADEAQYPYESFYLSNRDKL
jgi:hypothetical protein